MYDLVRVRREEKVLHFILKINFTKKKVAKRIRSNTAAFEWACKVINICCGNFYLSIKVSHAFPYPKLSKKNTNLWFQTKFFLFFFCVINCRNAITILLISNKQLRIKWFFNFFFCNSKSHDFHNSEFESAATIPE